MKQKVHPDWKVMILNEYASSYSAQYPASSRQVMRIFDISVKLFIEKLFVTGVTGVTNIKIPVSLDSGIYTVVLIAGGIVRDSQKMLVS